MKKTIKMGIGFATGRKGFQNVLKMNVYNWRESGLTEKEQISLNLFIAYDLKYSNTKSIDYRNISSSVMNLVDNAFLYGGKQINDEVNRLLEANVISEREAKLFFASGYAAKRNTILYFALKNQMDYLIFLDDDEYPMAVTNSKTTVLWGGQHVLATHLKHIGKADITNGHHCGYISPIPHITFNDILPEDSFRMFIEAISNDIINWTNVKAVMENGGVTYADKDILIDEDTDEVQEINGAKFISGSNLCLNLKDPSRIHPFYNPPNARGEDTFLSTCLKECRVVRVPCYTFHDAFSMYKPLMDGVLPISLKHITADSKEVNTRFYKACVGWIRYKPLLTYITQPDSYEDQIAQMQKNLTETLPAICEYFQNNDFMNIAKELQYYHTRVHKHYREFTETQKIWIKLQEYLKSVVKS